jgi:hypothetical protein
MSFSKHTKTRARLCLPILIVEREPSDVYLACAFKDARRHVQAAAVVFYHNIRLIRSVESLIRTK